VLVSSHVLTEVAQLADDVVIIAKGRSLVQSSVPEVLARAQQGTRVRTPQRDELVAALGARGIHAAAHGSDLLVVAAEARAVGEAAAAAGVVLHELTTETGTLEDVFLELTEGEHTPA
jgi:ABC-2 type transport system ATP-binding protein